MANPLGQFASSSFTPIFNTRNSSRASRALPGGGGGFGGAGGGGGYSEENDNQSSLAGWKVTHNPFTYGLGTSMGVMNNLGDTVGGAFGGVNALNLQSAMQDRKLATLGQLLGQFFNTKGNGGSTSPFPTGGSFRDTQSRQAVSY